MKSLMMIATLSVALLSGIAHAADVSATAEGTLIKGTSSWSKESDSDYRFRSFSALERLGVERDAELDALNNCREQGFQNCSVLGVKITACEKTLYNSQCKGEATVLGK